MTDATQIPPAPETRPSRLSIFGDTKVLTGILATFMTLLFGAVVMLSMVTGLKLDADVKQTLFALTVATWGFFFGSSTGSKSKDEPKPIQPK
jgi:hypothetical protein